MSPIQKKMITRAYRRHPDFRPVGGRSTFRQCFTECEVGVVFWYDTPDRSTHVFFFKDREQREAA